MKTTRKQALRLYNIAIWIDSYCTCYIDKEEHIKTFMDIDFEQNIKNLNNYICEMYETTRDLLDDTKLLKLYVNLITRKD